MTITLGDISVRYINLMLETAVELGLNKAELQHRYSLPTSLLTQAHARISIPKFMRVGHDIIEQTGYDELGLHMGKKATPALMGLTGFTASCAATLKQAMVDMARFETLSSNNARGHSTFTETAQHGVGEFYSVSPYNTFNFFIVDLALSVQFHLIQAFSAYCVRPVEIDIEFKQPAYAERYGHYFQCPVHFNRSRNALIYRRTDLTKPNLLANPVAYSECRQLCEQQWQQAQQQQTFLERVMDAISPLLSSQELTLEQVATRLELPPWTLQRKLKAENTTFKQLLDDTRKALALIYIRDQRYSLGEIAYLLGFSYPNAFQRAFKRWTSLTPGEYRKKSA